MKRKVLAVAGVTLMMALSLVGCGTKKTECAMCGEVKECKQLEYEGEKAYFCDTCYDLMEGLIDLLG